MPTKPVGARKAPAKRTSTAAQRALVEGYRSGLEEKIATDLERAGHEVQFETLKIPFIQPVKPRHYTPDFPLRNGIVVETKGRFMTDDRVKHKLIKDQHPDLDIRFPPFWSSGGVVTPKKARAVQRKDLPPIGTDKKGNPTNDWKGEGKDQRAVLVKVSLKEADEIFYSQILSGDAVDGYPGCPNVGKKRALDIVRNGTYTFPHETEIKRGPNAGTTRVQWKTKHLDNPWMVIVSHYEKAGMTEEDALQTARVARILRAAEYNFKTMEPILWTPMSA